MLNEGEAAVNPVGFAAVLYATASGQQAFQQRRRTEARSIFSQALLDGRTANASGKSLLTF
jgi:hypothetical protein